MVWKKKTIQLIRISVIRILLENVIQCITHQPECFLAIIAGINTDAAPKYLFYFYFMGTGNSMFPFLYLMLENLHTCLILETIQDLNSRVFYASVLYMAAYLNLSHHSPCLSVILHAHFKLFSIFRKGT